jgi:D-serine deaminase-like pyridoxal phosphate-dependent protein
VPLEVRIEIDSGLRRCGVPPGDSLVHLARTICDTRWLKLEGIFTHAGQVYGATDKKEVHQTGIRESLIMEEAVALLQKDGIYAKIVSVGSTPTVPVSVQSGIVNEIRPGNYVFYDGIQRALGVCLPGQCSLFVLATIISKPAPQRVIIDAGSKALNLDRGAQSHIMIDGYGTLLNFTGTISRLSEEHGIIELEQPIENKIGSPVFILPNHACAVSNLFENYYLVDQNGYTQIPVSARGKSQ